MSFDAERPPLLPQKPSALHIRIFRHRTPLVSRQSHQTKFFDSTEPKALTYSNLSPTNVTPCSNRSHRTKFFDFHRNHQTDPLAVYRNRRTEPIAAHQSHQGNSVPSAGKKKNIQTRPTRRHRRGNSTPPTDKRKTHKTELHARRKATAEYRYPLIFSPHSTPPRLAAAPHPP